MTRLSPDTRAVVAAVDRLTTQVRRLADTRQTRTVDIDDAPTTTADDGPCAQHPHAPVIGGHCGGCTVYPADMRPVPAADEEQQRTTRRYSIGILLSRTGLTPDEDALLRRHVEAEMRDADTARADLTRYEEVQGAMNERAIDLTRRVEELEDELRRWHAAHERVRAVARDWGPTLLPHSEAHRLLTDLHRALDGTEQPTTPEA